MKCYKYPNGSGCIYADRSKILLSHSAVEDLETQGFVFSTIREYARVGAAAPRSKPPSRVSVFEVLTPDGQTIIVENMTAWLSDTFSVSPTWVYGVIMKTWKYRGYTFRRAGYRILRKKRYE